jgi:hypothetical protein
MIPRRTSVRPPELYFHSTPQEPLPVPPTPQKQRTPKKVNRNILLVHENPQLEPTETSDKTMQTLPEKKDKGIQAKTDSPVKEFKEVVGKECL